MTRIGQNERSNCDHFCNSILKPSIGFVLSTSNAVLHSGRYRYFIGATSVAAEPFKKSNISGEKMNTNRKTSKKVVRVVPASAYRHLDNKLNREKKQSKALRRMRLEREDD